jgi:hypothetical protein
MGGVDLADMFHALYRIDRRSKKYYMRIVYFLIGVAISNAWLIQKINNPDKYNLLRKFQLSLSISLMKCNEMSANNQIRRRRRSRDSESSVNSSLNTSLKNSMLDVENMVGFD